MSFYIKRLEIYAIIFMYGNLPWIFLALQYSLWVEIFYYKFKIDMGFHFKNTFIFKKTIKLQSIMDAITTQNMADLLIFFLSRHYLIKQNCKYNLSTAVFLSPTTMIAARFLFLVVNNIKSQKGFPSQPYFSYRFLKA